MPLEPFSIPFSHEAVGDLRDRLARTRWPDEIPGSGWEYGFDLRFLQEICDYWRGGVFWKGQVEKTSPRDDRPYGSGGVGITFFYEAWEGRAPIPFIPPQRSAGSFFG